MQICKYRSFICRICKPGMKAGLPFPGGSIEESTGVLGEQRPVDREAQLPGHMSEGPSEGCQGPSVARTKRKTIGFYAH